MNTLSWLSLGLTFLFVLLFIIFHIKEMNLYLKISAALLLPCLATLSASLLLSYLPDSTHLITVNIIAFTFSSISLIFFYFDKKMSFRIIARCFFLATILVWLILFKSTFYIYTISIPILIVSAVIYTGLLILLLIKGNVKKLSNYFWSIISFFLCASLHFCATITLFAGKQLYSLILFLGTTLYIVLDMYYLLSYKKESVNNFRLLYVILLITSQVLVSASCYLMIC